MHIDILRRLRDAVRRKRPEIWRTNMWFLLTTTPQHTGRCCSRIFFFSKVVCQTLDQPQLSGLHLFFFIVVSTEISIEGTALLWCHWYNSECNGRAEKAFTKWMFPTSLPSLVEVYSCWGEIMWKKYNLNDCTVVYFSEIQWFQEHFESTTY